MGTEQQEELKSVKSSIKSKRKVIPFTDRSIEAWRLRKDKGRVGLYRFKHYIIVLLLRL